VTRVSILVGVLVASSACSDAATRLAYDIEGGAAELCNGGHLVGRVIHKPRARPEGCAGAYVVTLQESLHHPRSGGSLLVGCVGSPNYESFGYSYSTTYHLNTVRVPRELHVEKPSGASVAVVLQYMERRKTACVIEVVELQ
jgi:hypothetical protein